KARADQFLTWKLSNPRGAVHLITIYEIGPFRIKALLYVTLRNAPPRPAAPPSGTPLVKPPQKAMLAIGGLSRQCFARGDAMPGAAPRSTPSGRRRGCARDRRA